MRQLSDDLLLKETKVWVSKEREATLQLIAHLEEVERRRLFLERGFSSLFQFCVKYLGLSEGAASRRINAMRLTREVPSVKEKLSSGELSLSSASLTQSFMKHQSKIEKKTLSSEQKEKLVEEVSVKSSTLEVKRAFVKMSPSFEKREVQRPLTETTTRLSFVAQNSLCDKLERIKQIHSHKLKNFDLETVIEFMADRLLKEKEHSCRKASPREKHALPRSIAPSKRREVFEKAQHRCMFVDLKTRRRCEARSFLQVDHKLPVALGGSNHFENLRVYCSNHNRHTWQLLEESKFA